MKQCRLLYQPFKWLTLQMLMLLIIRAISSIPRQQMVKYVKNCVQPGLDYFDKQLNTSLKVSLSAFKAARLLCPYQVNTLNPTAADVDELSAFPFVDNLASLKSELASYLAKSDSLNSSMDIVSWWKQYTHDLPAWSAAAKKVATSCSAILCSCGKSLLYSQFYI